MYKFRRTVIVSSTIGSSGSSEYATSMLRLTPALGFAQTSVPNFTVSGCSRNGQKLRNLLTTRRDIHPGVIAHIDANLQASFWVILVYYFFSIEC